MFDAEQRALDQLDIPYFEASTSDDVLITPAGTRIRGLLAGASFDAVTSHILCFSDTDCQRQIGLIQGSFEARDMRPPSDPEGPSTFSVSPSAQAVEEPDYIGEALAIAELLKAQCVEDDFGGAHWIGLASVGSSSRYCLRLLGPALYEGISGIALYFAALYAVTGDKAARQWALKVAATMRMELSDEGLNRDQQRRLITANGIGAGSGLGGIIYALAVAGELVSDSTLFEQALRLSSYLTDDLIANNDQCDVVSGAAGAALGLLKLWSATRERDVLNKAERCGLRLVDKQGTHGGWDAESGTALTGFAHGAAGISLALSLLHSYLPEGPFLDAARRAVEFERRAFSPEHNNWPDYRNWSAGEPLRFRVAWCHGASGIGLARLGCLSLGAPAFEDLEAALRCASQEPASAIDTICCGEMGIADFLLESGVKLNRTELIEAAHRRASSAVARAKVRRGANPHGYLLGGCTRDGKFSHGLFQGLSGIGYTLLRLAAPGILPCVALIRLNGDFDVRTPSVANRSQSATR